MAEKTMMYRFYELRDEIKKSIANLNLIEEQQKGLVELIINAHKDDVYKDFIKATSSEWKDYELQRANLNTQLKAINELIAIHEAKDDKSDLLNEWVVKIFTALGVSFRDERSN